MSLRQVLQKRLQKGFFFAKTPTYEVAVEKRATAMDVRSVGPMSGKAPLKFTLHFTLDEVDGPGLNDKTCNLYVDGVIAQTIVSHGIYGWYGAIGWMNGCVDFEIELDSGAHDIYAEFEGDTEYEGCS